MRQSKLEQAVQAVMLDPRNSTTLEWYWTDVIHSPRGTASGLYLDTAEMRFEYYSNPDSIPLEFWHLMSREGMQLSDEDKLAFKRGYTSLYDYGYEEFLNAVQKELTDYLNSIGEYDD
jgi:hypothetical protein